MQLTPTQTRRRRNLLLVAALISAGLLGAAVWIPDWPALAGGVERGEGGRAARKKAQAKVAPGPEVVPAPRSQRRPKQPRPARHVSRPTIAQPPPILGPMQQGPLPPLPPLPRPAQSTASPGGGAPTASPSSQAPGTQASPNDPIGVPVESMKALFRRPDSPRLPAAEVALGARLFRETKLSSDHKMSCATCHDPARSFTDGRTKARGNRGEELPRNTPSIWNLADARSFYWDGRSRTLEAQAKDAIEREGEMDGTLEAAVLWLSRDPTYVAEFARVYPGPQPLNGDTLLRALTNYERSLVSPQTRFDRWIDGDIYALTDRETAGFRLFTGKGRCLACHGGWRLTDDDFHDIGLRSKDKGRAALPGSTTGDRTFKTPSLRELMWSAPYMHDGSLKTLEDVLAHYGGKLEQRNSLAPELKQPIVLSAGERTDLIAFLKTLSSEQMPRPPR